eukprot:jgi/Galph1/378/GphlegSOOS_G5069.1
MTDNSLHFPTVASQNKPIYPHDPHDPSVVKVKDSVPAMSSGQQLTLLSTQQAVVTSDTCSFVPCKTAANIDNHMNLQKSKLWKENPLSYFNPKLQENRCGVPLNDETGYPTLKRASLNETTAWEKHIPGRSNTTLKGPMLLNELAQPNNEEFHYAIVGKEQRAESGIPLYIGREEGCIETSLMGKNAENLETRKKKKEWHRRLDVINNEQYMTLPLCILEFMRSVRRPVSENEIIQEAREKYPLLRKSDGTKYKENQIRAVKGSLCSTGIFVKLPNRNEWMVNEDAAKQYEMKMSHKQHFSPRRMYDSNERRKHNRGIKKVGVEKEQEFKSVKSPSYGYENVNHERSYFSVMSWLFTISEQMQKEQRWNECFLNPFENFTEVCSLDILEDKLGTEKLIHFMQMFHFLKDWLIWRPLKNKMELVETSHMEVSEKPLEHAVNSSDGSTKPIACSNYSDFSFQQSEMVNMVGFPQELDEMNSYMSSMNNECPNFLIQSGQEEFVSSDSRNDSIPTTLSHSDGSPDKVDINSHLENIYWNSYISARIEHSDLE